MPTRRVPPAIRHSAPCGKKSSGSSPLNPFGDNAKVPGQHGTAPGEFAHCADTQPGSGHRPQEAGQGLAVETDSPSDPRTVTGAAVCPSNLPVPADEGQP